MVTERKTKKAKKSEARAKRTSQVSPVEDKNNDMKPSLSYRLNDALEKVELKESQQKFFDTILKNEITFCQGPAGTSKTFTTCYAAIKLLAHNRIKKIVFCKPASQVKSEAIGFIPGSISDKLAPIVESYRYNIEKIVGKELLEILEKENIIEYKPLAFMRGISADYAFMVLDESQNADYHSLILFITRMGHNSKSVLMGDVSQYDIDRKSVKFPDFVKMFEKIKGVGVHYYTNADIVRNKILIEITEIYEKWKFDNNL